MGTTIDIAGMYKGYCTGCRLLHSLVVLSQSVECQKADYARHKIVRHTTIFLDNSHNMRYSDLQNGDESTMDELGS